MAVEAYGRRAAPSSRRLAGWCDEINANTRSLIIQAAVPLNDVGGKHLVERPSRVAIRVDGKVKQLSPHAGDGSSYHAWIVAVVPLKEDESPASPALYSISGHSVRRVYESGYDSSSRTWGQVPRGNVLATVTSVTTMPVEPRSRTRSTLPSHHTAISST